MSLTNYPLQNASIFTGAAIVYGQQQDEIPAGCVGFGDLAVAARGTPAMAVTVAAGVCYVNMQTSSGGLRRLSNSGSSDSGTSGSLNSTDWLATFTAADATNPRIDSVYLIARDSTIDSTGAQDAKLQVVAGVATVGATLDNRTGAGAAPSNSTLLADVLISANQTTVTTAKIRDRRQFGPQVVPPVFGTVADLVPLVPVAGLTVTSGALFGATNAQFAYAAWLPRRIVNATKIRWGYRQTATPTTGTYNIAICDSSGRPIQACGSTAFTGIANTDQVRSETITAQTFEAGMYWVLYGQVLSAGASVLSQLVSYKSGTAEIPFQSIAAYLAAGTGTTFPSAINGTTNPLTDPAATPTNTQYGGPVVALSVG